MHFMQENVDEIIKIRPSKRNENDFIAWHPEKQGLFTVRSTYRMALHDSMQRQDRGATSMRSDGARPSWNIIWKCQVPAKMKIIAWKICRNAISTQVNVAKRGIATTKLCPICGLEDEDSFHVFTRCPHAQSLWQAMAEVWPLLLDNLLINTGTEWLLHLLVSIADEQRAPVLMTLWRMR
jgi:hypothetical protein